MDWLGLLSLDMDWWIGVWKWVLGRWVAVVWIKGGGGGMGRG